MARRSEVFVRSLEPEEAQRLVKIIRSAKDRVRLRRAGVVLASVQGRSAGEIAVMFAASEGYVLRSSLAHIGGLLHGPAHAADALEALLADQLQAFDPDHPQTVALRNAIEVMRSAAG